MKNGILLSMMMFLQYIAMPVWFVPLLPYVKSLPGGEDWALWCGLIMGFGTFTSAFFGMFADRFFNAEKVLAFSNAAGAVLLSLSYFVKSPAVLFALLLLTMCFYMPTWSLTTTIALAHAEKRIFPRLRVFGTVGWVASGLFSFVALRSFGIEAFDSTPLIFAAGAVVSALAAVLALFLPATEPVAKGTPLSVVDALGLRALALFRNREFRAFAFVLLFAMIPFQWYNVYGAEYLKQSGFRHLTMTLNLGQAGEIGFMLLVPWIISRFGFRRAMVIAFAAMSLRYGCFLLSSLSGLHVFDFGGILIHGLIFGTLIIGSQMHIDEIAPRELRNQAQGLVMLLSAGIGIFASNFVFDAVIGSFGWTVAFAVALSLAVLGKLLTLLLMR